jgi:hypothetical protein
MQLAAAARGDTSMAGAADSYLACGRDQSELALRLGVQTAFRTAALPAAGLLPGRFGNLENQVPGSGRTERGAFDRPEDKAVQVCLLLAFLDQETLQVLARHDVRQGGVFRRSELEDGERRAHD